MYLCSDRWYFIVGLYLKQSRSLDLDGVWHTQANRGGKQTMVISHKDGVRADPQYMSFSFFRPHTLRTRLNFFFLFLKQSEHLRQHLTHHFHSNVKLIADIPGAGVSSLGWCAACNGHALSPSQYPGWDVRGKPETTMLPWQRRGDGNNYQCLLWKRA